MTSDYDLPAELFTAKRKGAARSRLGYRRFAAAAGAIRFIVEGFPTVRTLRAWMQVGDARHVAALAEDYSLLPAARTRTDGSVLPLRSHLLHSASRLAAGAIGFLIFSQSSTRPER
jgi:hypothetical protein